MCPELPLCGIIKSIIEGLTFNYIFVLKVKDEKELTELEEKARE